eukprot:GHVS01081483.1.p1 GENE.GHVS01081483.1~~GHVS01081483.1.p1  ORF type:complete len:280 (+),score=104.15 GHVS01081483.1:687-1526(+)
MVSAPVGCNKSKKGIVWQDGGGGNSSSVEHQEKNNYRRSLLPCTYSNNITSAHHNSSRVEMFCCDENKASRHGGESNKQQAANNNRASSTTRSGGCGESTRCSTFSSEDRESLLVRMRRAVLVAEGATRQHRRSSVRTTGSLSSLNSNGGSSNGGSSNGGSSNGGSSNGGSSNGGSSNGGSTNGGSSNGSSSNGRSSSVVAQPYVTTTVDDVVPHWETWLCTVARTFGVRTAAALLQKGAGCEFKADKQSDGFRPRFSSFFKFFSQRHLKDALPACYYD